MAEVTDKVKGDSESDNKNNILLGVVVLMLVYCTVKKIK